MLAARLPAGSLLPADLAALNAVIPLGFRNSYL